MENKSTWKRVGLGAVSLASVALLAACGGGNKSAANKDEINWYTPTEILSLDISKNTDQYSALAIGNSSSNLLRVDKNGNPKPDLAKSVEVSEDGLTYTATLRDGLKWSDGSALAADDFVYTWQRMVDPKTASEYSYLAVESHLENADKINSGEITDLNQLGVKADGNKVTFTLTSPCPQFKYYLAFSNFMPQKKAFVEKEGDKYATTSKNQLYSGPYTIKGWNGSDGSFTLVKNKYYWDAKHVKTKKVNLQAIKKADTAVQMYKNGELDTANISATSSIYKANKSNKEAVPVPEARMTYIVYNETGSVASLANEKIRQALNLATDRKGIVEAAIDTGSKPATALPTPGLAKLTDGTDLSKYVEPGYKYDEKAAAKLFKEGLADLGTNSVKLTVTADSDDAVTKAAVDYIKQSWEEALPGLKIEEKFVTFKQRLEDTKNQNFEVALVSWGGDYPEGSTFYGLFSSASAYNYGKVSSPEFDQAYNKALTTDALDTDAAAADYKAAEKVLYEGAHYNPIYFRSTEWLQNPDLKNLVRNSTGLTVDFSHAYKK
ncbi:ABC transporter, substrate-binding protein [Streptococcus infantarius subsp. infantarius]|uniref:peptide ABC transporter substrate-binding protein n=1 Tax=Streptococcus TaxID=1301 RepID=UPI000EBABCBB|nr:MULTISPECIES: peptide ABC transporter substrate-binding protein [Streptococcus]MBT0931948.1 peptide ABC transporter substrate-binding protein [Streptococcus infantarius subsp. infantarius]MCO4577966.1 ABC transporter, substrate-binding protein [Streptococcus infantarius subsp. infantarius]MCO4579851.1 ABC transporter, substrate-binding protein [Streptococcus infantarius subsp. infantarius]MCO4581855.1 ABC transporter, substrate-binding protein [Streptococcus infantarius subsp. infantarius]M